MEDWTGSELRKEYIKAILSPCLFNLYAEYIMQNAGLDSWKAGIKTARRNIKYFRYAVDTTLIAEGEEKRRNFLMKVKEKTEKAGLKLDIQTAKIQPHHFMANRWGKKWKQ